MVFTLFYIAATMPSTQLFRINNIQQLPAQIVRYFENTLFHYGQPLMRQQVRRTILALCCSGTYSGRRCLETGHGTRLAYGMPLAYNSCPHCTVLNHFMYHNPPNRGVLTQPLTRAVICPVVVD